MLKFEFARELDAKYQAAIEGWQAHGKVRRLWEHDASLWTNADEAKWMGWLDIVDEQLRNVQTLLALQKESHEKQYRHAVLLGMGGSSLCPEVTAFTFGKQNGYPELLILDSTNPEQIEQLERKIEYKSTVFIVASKSGSTLEPNIFKQYFFQRAKEKLGDHASEHFIAITDPGSKMQAVAETDNFAHIYFGDPSIGGRYSALSNFGMAPAAIAGVDVRRLLDGAKKMVESCKLAAEQNPGVLLGCALGVLGNAGHDKVTIVASPAISDFGAWLEQLLAESTGKIGKGLVPVDREPLGAPGVYGTDRLFVYVRLTSNADAAQDAAVDRLKKAAQPVVRIDVEDVYEIGGEYFRWEVATAVAGSLLGINPFNQPDVEAAKIATRALTEEYESQGSLPHEPELFEENGIKLFADAANAAELKRAAHEHSLKGYLRAHINRLHKNDYFALLAFIDMDEQHESELQRIRLAVRDGKKVATCLGFGPRFLHSTGQAYKGGPDSGVFLQVTCNYEFDLAVPGQKYTFGIVQAAQARGDFQVLNERKRRALRIHLPQDVSDGLERIASIVKDLFKE
ncbi:MAG: bifunctional transaldolase/phosoglucose isomerase [Acidobacteriaceae bacterium]